jgi:type IV pilus assembly protein PilO
MKGIKFNELNMDNIGQWPMPAKIMLIFVMGLFVVGLGYWLIIKSNLESYDALTKQEKTLKEEFELNQQQSANLLLYRTQMVEMEQRFGSMLKKLPTQNEMPGLLEDISKTGISSGLTFELFAPMPEIQHDFYIELPIKIAVVGNYHQLAVFVSRIVQMNRIVTLHDFTIEGIPQDKQKTVVPMDQLIMHMTAKIYRYRSQNNNENKKQ